MERVGVVVHPTRPVHDALEALSGWTEERGLELVQILAGEQPSVAPPGEVSACDLIAALGGDGTVLKALHVAARTGTLVLGVAYGSLGVLTTVPEDELVSALNRFEAGSFLSHELPALALSTGEKHRGCAINDIVVARRGGTQLILEVYVDEELYARLAGDGLVIATPLGSAAYSMAAGGPLLAVGMDAVLCTPLAMHGGCAPPLVVPADRTITLAAYPGHTGFGVQIDGSEVEIDAEKFQIRREPGYAALVHVDQPGSGLTRLRQRGLVTDSPRVVAASRQSAPAEERT